jgi:N-acetylneuraminic acid mutarotase
MIIFGGKNDSYLSDVYEYDVETSIWTQVDPFGETPTPRYGHSCVMIYGTMIVSGGYGLNYYLNEVYALDLESYTWTKFKTQESRPKLYHHRSTV